MTEEDTSRYVRLQVELVLEIADAEALIDAAVAHVENDDSVPDEERRHAVSAIRAEPGGAAEAIAYLVDPIDLVSGAPGVELAQASWSSETVDDAADEDSWLLGAAEFEEALAAEPPRPAGLGGTTRTDEVPVGKGELQEATYRPREV